MKSVVSGLTWVLLLGPALFLGAEGFTDGTGHRVVLSRPPQAVVSLTLMTDEFLSELLPPDRIRAYSRAVDDPVLSNAAVRARAVRSRAWINLEQLVSLGGDLIVAADWADGADLDFLRQKGMAVYSVKTPRSWADVRGRLADLGAVLGTQDRASEILGGLTLREARLADRRARVVHPVSLLEYNSFGRSMGPGTLWDDLLRLAGVTDAAAGLGGDQFGYALLSKEVLVRLNPDWLVLPSAGALSAYGKSAFLDDLKADPLYRSLGAVKAGRILFLSEALKTTTSQAALGAAEAIQNAAYPDLR